MVLFQNTTKLNSALRLTSFLTVLSFSVTSIAGATPFISSVPVSSEFTVPVSISVPPINIPTELATVEEYAGTFEDNRPTFFYIQDAHGNYDAQKSTKALLDYLKKEEGVTLALVEGAAKELSADRLRFFPDDNLNKKLADIFAKKGALNGLELYLLDSDSNYKALGVEDPSLYAENLKSFRRVLRVRAKTEFFLTAVRAEVDRISNHLLNRVLREFVQKHEAYRTGSLDLSHFMTLLIQHANEKLRLDFTNAVNQIEWPQIFRFALLLNYKEKMDSRKLKKDVEKLEADFKTWSISTTVVDQLNNLISLKPTELFIKKPNTVSPRRIFEDLYGLAAEKGFRFDSYPALSLFAKQIILQSELEPAALEVEVANLSSKVREAMVENQTESLVIALLDDLYLLDQAVTLSLDKKGLEAFRKRMNALEPSMLTGRTDELSKEAHLSINQPEQLKEAGVKLEGFLSAVNDFYVGSEKRDEVIVKNAFAVMKEYKNNKAALITGGFHTSAIKELIKKNQASYMLLTPRIHSLDINRENYYKIMMEDLSFKTSHIMPAGLTMPSDVQAEIMAESGSRPNFLDGLAINAFVELAGTEGLTLPVINTFDPEGTFVPNGRRFDRTVIVGSDGTVPSGVRIRLGNVDRVIPLKPFTETTTGFRAEKSQRGIPVGTVRDVSVLRERELVPAGFGAKAVDEHVRTQLIAQATALKTSGLQGTPPQVQVELIEPMGAVIGYLQKGDLDAASRGLKSMRINNAALRTRISGAVITLRTSIEEAATAKPKRSETAKPASTGFGAAAREVHVDANWKMSIASAEEARQLLLQMAAYLAPAHGKVGVTIFVSPVHIQMLAAKLKQYESAGEIQKGLIHLGAQNISTQLQGAFTNEVSLLQLEDLGIKHVLLGHSEVRRWTDIEGMSKDELKEWLKTHDYETNETDERVARKTIAALSRGFTVTFALGETFRERLQNLTEQALVRQLDALFNVARKLNKLDVLEQAIRESRFKVAYEPVWAIGTGEQATKEQANEAHLIIRNEFERQFGSAELSSIIPIQYGGSVKGNTAPDLFAQDEIDGALVGGASLKADDFTPIVTAGIDRAKRLEEAEPFNPDGDGPGGEGFGFALPTWVGWDTVVWSNRTRPNVVRELIGHINTFLEGDAMTRAVASNRPRRKVKIGGHAYDHPTYETTTVEVSGITYTITILSANSTTSRLAVNELLDPSLGEDGGVHVVANIDTQIPPPDALGTIHIVGNDIIPTYSNTALAHGDNQRRALAIIVKFIQKYLDSAITTIDYAANAEMDPLRGAFGEALSDLADATGGKYHDSSPRIESHADLTAHARELLTGSATPKFTSLAELARKVIHREFNPVIDRQLLEKAFQEIQTLNGADQHGFGAVRINESNKRARLTNESVLANNIGFSLHVALFTGFIHYMNKLASGVVEVGLGHFLQAELIGTIILGWIAWHVTVSIHEIGHYLAAGKGKNLIKNEQALYDRMMTQSFVKRISWYAKMFFTIPYGYFSGISKAGKVVAAYSPRVESTTLNVRAAGQRASLYLGLLTFIPGLAIFVLAVAGAFGPAGSAFEIIFTFFSRALIATGFVSALNFSFADEKAFWKLRAKMKVDESAKEQARSKKDGRFSQMSREELLRWFRENRMAVVKNEQGKFLVKAPWQLRNTIQGGRHVAGQGSNISFQEFMLWIVPRQATTEEEALEEAAAIAATIQAKVMDIINESQEGIRYMGQGIEGGVVATFTRGEEQVLEVLTEAIETANPDAPYIPGEDVFIALDPAASELTNAEQELQDETDPEHKLPEVVGKYRFWLAEDQKVLMSEEMVDFYDYLVEKFPWIISIEDAMAENDIHGWELFKARLGKKIFVVGDDLIVTNARIIEKRAHLITDALIKVNQIGTITETLFAIHAAFKHHLGVIISHRSKAPIAFIEPILSLAFWALGQKTGGAVNAERISKYEWLQKLIDKIRRKVPAPRISPDAEIIDLIAYETMTNSLVPTVEVEVTVKHGDNIQVFRGATPVGTSSGSMEAYHIVDGDKKRHKGKGQKKAVAGFKEHVTPLFIGKKARELGSILDVDRQLLMKEYQLALKSGALKPGDDTEKVEAVLQRKKHLGLNATLPTSEALLYVIAASLGVYPHEYIRSFYETEIAGQSLEATLTPDYQASNLHIEAMNSLYEVRAAAFGVKPEEKRIKFPTQVRVDLRPIFADVPELAGSAAITPDGAIVLPARFARQLPQGPNAFASSLVVSSALAEKAVDKSFDNEFAAYILELLGAGRDESQSPVAQSVILAPSIAEATLGKNAFSANESLTLVLDTAAVGDDLVLVEQTLSNMLPHGSGIVLKGQPHPKLELLLSQLADGQKLRYRRVPGAINVSRLAKELQKISAEWGISPGKSVFIFENAKGLTSDASESVSQALGRIPLAIELVRDGLKPSDRGVFAGLTLEAIKALQAYDGARNAVMALNSVFQRSPNGSHFLFNARIWAELKAQLVAEQLTSAAA